MKIAKYWARESTKVRDGNGREFDIACWRSSNESPAQARSAAAEAARKIAGRFINRERPGAYQYSDRPLREEIIEEIRDGGGKLTAAITRNAYGALVLNTDRVMFVDIDLGPEGLLHRIKRMLGLAGDRAEETMQFLRDWLKERGGWGFRVYRTCNGFRLLVTHAEFDPTRQETMDVLQSLGSDALYIKLCKAQESFRARLSPKPWRMELENPPNRYPRLEREEEDNFIRWLKQYESRIKNFAVCRFIEHLGYERISGNIDRIVKLHDRYSLSDGARELA